MITQTPIRHKTNEQEQPEPIRVIRKINGRYQWVILKSKAEMTYNERRAAYNAMCDAFDI
jgi:hypothetical protein